VANWISTELLRRLNEAGKEIESCPVPPGALAELLAKIESGEITAATGKKVFATMFDTGKGAAAIISAEGMAQITDVGAIEKIARSVVAKNADNAAKYRAGNEGVFKFFVGQVMRETRGQASPQVVNDVLKRVLAEA
jgi:aspartyl-tRNA(Asn)/glutamyl-tRNA(Gln) amidotransferase subunit B